VARSTLHRALLVAPVAITLALSGCAVAPANHHRSESPASGAVVAAEPAPRSTVTTAPRATPSTSPSSSPAQPTTSPATPATDAPTMPALPEQGAKVNCRRVKCIALTFDDGPGPYTLHLLNDLRAADARATFFMVGTQVAAHPSVAHAVAADGNEIGIHTWDHPNLTKLSPARINQEITSTAREIEKAAGFHPRFLRPPYGAMNAQVHTVAGEDGLAMALWSVDTLDWKTRSTAKTVAAALGGARRGRIILLHDIHPWSVAAVPQIVQGLQKQGYTLVTVSELLGKVKPGRAYSGR